MKYIFWVHSHITYLVTTSIIKQLEIEDAIIILTRNYSVPFEINAKLYNFPFYYTPYPSQHRLISNFKISKSLNAIKACNRLIDEIIKNENFIFYTPLYNQPAIRCFIEHENCKRFYYIEEGTASYKPLSHFTQHRSTLKQLTKELYFRLLPYSNIIGGYFFDSTHIKFSGCYSFFNDAFPWNEKEKYILELTPVLKVKEIETDAFLFFDALVEFGLVEEKIFLKVFIDVIEYFVKEGFKAVSFKFHPEQAKESAFKNQIINIFSKYSDIISFKELNQDFIAENYFLQHKSKVFVFLSSVGLYAQKNNSDVISLIPFFEKYDFKFFSKFKSVK